MQCVLKTMKISTIKARNKNQLTYLNLVRNLKWLFVWITTRSKMPVRCISLFKYGIGIREGSGMRNSFVPDVSEDVKIRDQCCMKEEPIAPPLATAKHNTERKFLPCWRSQVRSTHAWTTSRDPRSKYILPCLWSCICVWFHHRCLKFDIILTCLLRTINKSRA